MAQEKVKNQEWLNRIEREVISQALSGGIDLEVGAKTQYALQDALHVLLERLSKDAKHPKGMCRTCKRGALPSGRDINALINGLSEYTRLLKFVQGEPDRLVGVSADDHSVLRWLTDEELDGLLEKVQQRKLLASSGAEVAE